MKIGYDGSRAFVSGRTGTENYSYQLLKHLAKLESRVQSLESRNQYIVYLRPGSETTEKWPENFKFVTIRFLRLWTQIGLAKQTFQDQLDVLLIPAHTSPLIHKPGLKTVVTVHDLGAEYLPKMHQLKQQLYLKWITNYQLKNASKLIAVSKATKADLVKKVGIDPKKIEVVYEGFDKELFKPVKLDILVNILKQFGIENDSYFLFVGTIQPRKNLERLIIAFSKFLSQDNIVNEPVSSIKYKVLRGKSKNLDTKYLIPNTKLVIAGGKGWLSDEIYRLPKKLEIADRVRFLGRVEDQDLPALYSGAIGLTFPSLFEGFGLPILEAQACGCPVITSNLSSMPDVAGKGAILVDPYSINNIVEGMRRVRSKRGELIKQGLENIKRFSWEKCAQETLAILEKVVK